MSNPPPERTQYKGRPSDHRPDGAAVCYICNGVGTLTGRTCKTCSGYGFLRPVQPALSEPLLQEIPPPPLARDKTSFDMAASRAAGLTVRPAQDTCLLCSGEKTHKRKTCPRCQGLGLDPWRVDPKVEIAMQEANAEARQFLKTGWRASETEIGKVFQVKRYTSRWVSVAVWEAMCRLGLARKTK
jgi:hypothetical protein